MRGRFEREIALKTDPDHIWTRLTDLELLASFVSVIGSIQEVAPFEMYTAVLKDKVGPFTLLAPIEVSVVDLVEYERVSINGIGEDRQVNSRIEFDASLSLEPDEGGGGTVVKVRATYEVGGKVATFGEASIRKKAEKVIDEFEASLLREFSEDK